MDDQLPIVRRQLDRIDERADALEPLATRRIVIKKRPSVEKVGLPDGMPSRLSLTGAL